MADHTPTYQEINQDLNSITDRIRAYQASTVGVSIHSIITDMGSLVRIVQRLAFNVAHIETTLELHKSKPAPAHKSPRIKDVRSTITADDGQTKIRVTADEEFVEIDLGMSANRLRLTPKIALAFAQTLEQHAHESIQMSNNGGD